MYHDGKTIRNYIKYRNSRGEVGEFVCVCCHESQLRRKFWVLRRRLRVPHSQKILLIKSPGMSADVSLRLVVN